MAYSTREPGEQEPKIKSLINDINNQLNRLSGGVYEFNKIFERINGPYPNEKGKVEEQKEPVSYIEKLEVIATRISTLSDGIEHQVRQFNDLI